MIEENRYKYETIEQRIYRYFIIGGFALLLISLIFLLLSFKVTFNKLSKISFRISMISFLLFILMVSMIVGYIFIKNETHKIGIKETIYKFKIRYKLEKALLDSKIYFERMNVKLLDNTILVSLPKIEIVINKGDMSGQILIENSIKYQDKLARIDLSSAIPEYVQESVYLLDNREWYVFNLDLDSSDFQFKFDSLNEFSEQTKRNNKQTLFIDKKFSEIPYYHWLISGQTGSGKTYALYSLIIQLKMQNSSIVIADPKSSNLAVFGEVLGVKTVMETQDIMVVLHQLVNEMNQRKKDVLESIEKSKKLDSTALDFGYQAKYIVIDEYAALQLRMDRKQKKELSSLIGQVLLEGRSLGCYVILAIQQANSKLIDTNLREQFQVQIVLGASGIQTYNVVFGPHLASLIPERQMLQGEGWVMISGYTVTPRLISFPYLNFEIIEELIQR